MASTSSTSAIDVERLSTRALEVESVQVDGWSETYGEAWEYAEAPSCLECGDYARWDDDEHVWRCMSEGCENNGGVVDALEGGAEGPMMNYHYPLPSLGDAADEYDAADRIRDLPLCVVIWQDGRGDDFYGSGEVSDYSLALTGGGMDLSWQICEAFMRLGFLPPARFADLPGMSGAGESDDDRVVAAACVRSLTEYAGWQESRAASARLNAANLRARYLQARAGELTA